MRAFLPMLVSLFVTVLSLGCTTDSTTDVTVPPPVASLSVQPTNAAIQVGKSTQLSAVALDSSGGTLIGRLTSWSSSDQSVAKVIRELGVVIGVAPGSADVIATAEGKSARARITVTTDPPLPPTLTQLVLTPASITLARGATSQFAVSGKWSDSSTTVPVVVYSATGGTITSGGLYTAGTTPGGFRVIATQQGGTLADTSTVTLTAPTLVRLVLTPASITLAPGATSQFTVSGKWSDSSTTVPTVTYSATGGTMTPGGLYTAGATPGTFRVIATQQGGTLADTSTVLITGSITGSTLRQLASARGFLMGTAVRIDPLNVDAQYRQTLSTQYNSVSPEGFMGFAVLHPGPTQYNFAQADQLVSFAQANGMTIHGPGLVWYNSLPAWVAGGSFTKAQLLAVLKDHITTVVGRYRGKIPNWDVVNEVTSWNGATGLQPGVWLNTIGPEYIDSAFVWAHAADPSAKLYLNDYAQESFPAKADLVFSLVQGLRSRGIPIDGVGFQAHLADPVPPASAFQNVFSRFANAGFDIRVSELDEQIPDSAGAQALTAEGAAYRDVLDACLRLPQCTGFTTWGFTDRYSWLPTYYPGFGRGLPLDANYQPKPAFDSLVVRLGQP